MDPAALDFSRALSGLELWPDLGRFGVLILTGANLAALLTGLVVAVLGSREGLVRRLDLYATVAFCLGASGLVLLVAEVQLSRIGMPATWRLPASLAALAASYAGLSYFLRARRRDAAHPARHT